MLIQLPDYFELHNEKTNCSNFGFPLSEKKSIFLSFGWFLYYLQANHLSGLKNESFIDISINFDN